MAYDLALFNKMVAAEGENRLIGIFFNNAYRRLFASEPFDPATMIDVETEQFKFVETDPSGIKFTVYKPIEYVEALAFANEEDFARLDTRSISG